MNKFFTLFLFAVQPFLSIAQCDFNDTIYVCVGKESIFVNTQYNGTTMQQNGTIYTLEEGNKHYQTIPEDYVFWPPYDTLPHTDTMRVLWRSIGTVIVKKTDYNFSGLVYYHTSVYSILDCRDIPPGNDTIIDSPSNPPSEKGLPDGIYIPNAVAPHSSGLDNTFYVSVSNELDVNVIDYMAVYNRWGGMVWEKKNITPNTQIEGWHCNDCSSGVYVWMMKIRLKNESGFYETKVFSGTVTVVN